MHTNSMKKIMFSQLLAGFLGIVSSVVVIGSAVTIVVAQGTADQAATLAADPTPSLQTEDARQKELGVLYQALVEDYATKVRQFNLNRAQWQTLQTLRSLEEAVAATTAVLISRDRVLITYFELLLTALEKAPGIELTFKEESKNQLINQIEWLRQHQARVETSVDRDSVNARSDELTQETAVMLAQAHRALMLIRLGQLQTTFDRSNSLYQRIIDRNAANPSTSLQEVERARAYDQVGILRDRIDADLRLARETLDPKTAQYGRVETEYSAFIAMLESPYANTSKYLSYLEELALDRW